MSEWWYYLTREFPSIHDGFYTLERRRLLELVNALEVWLHLRHPQGMLGLRFRKEDNRNA